MEPRAFLYVQIDVDPAYELEFNRWYDEEELPSRLACPGFRSGQRFRAMDAEARYLAVYELDGASVLESDAYRRISPLLNPTPWTKRIRAHFKQVTRRLFIQVAEPAGLRLVVSEPPRSDASSEAP